MTLSLRARMLIAATLVFAAFLGLTALVLDRAFQHSADKATRDRLQGYIYTLLAAAELDRRGDLRLPKNLPEPRFSLLGSGLYAEILGNNDKSLWRSKSALGQTVSFKKPKDIGKHIYERVKNSRGSEVYGLSYGIVWEEKGREQRYVFRVYESMDRYFGQVQRFRRSLFVWFGAAAILLLLVQALIIRWGMRPLTKVANDLAEVESGSKSQLSGQYPSDLRGLTDNLNALINSSKSHLQRYRDSLGNLAHSLKTPLAILQATVDDDSLQPEQIRKTTEEQIARMREIVEYQLQRASASGRSALSTPVNVAALVRRVVAALAKVYTSKNVQCNVDIDDAIAFYGDEDDLLELLGNVIDNAYKWCDRRVIVSAESLKTLDREYPGLRLVVDDDGPGVPEGLTERVRQRGQRADSDIPGHGLGLAMVQDTLQIYNGRLEIGASELGGARFVLFFD